MSAPNMFRKIVFAQKLISKGLIRGGGIGGPNKSRGLETFSKIITGGIEIRHSRVASLFLKYGATQMQYHCIQQNIRIIDNSTQNCCTAPWELVVLN